MPQHRANKSSWVGPRDQNQAWFENNRDRQRARRKMQKASKRRNRGR